MKPMLGAVIGACLAMLVTSGLIMLATAATPPKPTGVDMVEAEQELDAQLDRAITRQLQHIRLDLANP
jgi:hypothetical protein